MIINSKVYSSNHLFSYGQRSYLIGFENNSAIEVVRDFDIDSANLTVSEINDNGKDIKFSILAPVFIENEKVGYVSFKLLPRRLEDYFSSEQIADNNSKIRNRIFLTNADGNILAVNRQNHLYGNTHWLYEDSQNKGFSSEVRVDLILDFHMTATNTWYPRLN